MGKRAWKCCRFSLRATFVVVAAAALFSAALAGMLKRCERSLTRYTVANRPSAASFPCELDLWFRQHGFRPCAPSLNAWPRQGVRRELASGAEYQHYIGSHRGSPPFFVDVRVFREPDGLLNVNLSWGYEWTVRSWEYAAATRNGEAFFQELVTWCEQY